MNNHYRLYIEDTLNLVSAITIKFDDVASAVNLKVMVDYGLQSVDVNDKSSWKYYQNIAGKYHFSNTEMKIYSLDTTEEIVFTVQNLQLHPATRKAYLYGKRHYLQLVQKYPEQESLILGILYPADLQTSIDCPDGTIVSYPDYLIEENEYSLIHQLQEWVYAYVDRWINKQYSLAHDLYSTMYLGQLTMNLVPAIINMRLQRCKTNEAHSFHVRQYLASHTKLDKYLSLMTKKQALFFYRNIKYIQRNPGTKDTFDLLVQKLMTDRGLPLYEFTMKHDTSYMLGNVDNDYKIEYYPRVSFERTSVNPSVAQVADSDFSLNDVNEKILDLAPGNEFAISTDYYNESNKLELSKFSTLGTKLLESNLLDYTDSVPYTISDVITNHWLYYSSINVYISQITISILKDKSTVDISVKDSAIFFIYCLFKSVGIELETIPTYNANKVLVHPKRQLPTLDKYKSLYPKLTDKINNIFTVTPNISIFNSLLSFYEFCKDVYECCIMQNEIVSREEIGEQRQILKQAADSLFSDVRCNLSANEQYTVYSDWLLSKGFDTNDYSEDDFYLQAMSIVSENLNISPDSVINLRTLQSAMVQIFKTLSSYSIEIASDITQPPISLIPRLSARLDNIKFIQKSYDYGDINKIKVIESLSLEKMAYGIDVNLLCPSTNILNNEKSVVRVDLTGSTKINDISGDFETVYVKQSNVKVLNVRSNCRNVDQMVFAISTESIDAMIGDTIVYNINTEFVPDGTIVYLQTDYGLVPYFNTVDPTIFGTDSLDTTAIVVTINNNTASVSLVVTKNSHENSTLSLTLRRTVSGTLLARSNTVNILHKLEMIDLSGVNQINVPVQLSSISRSFYSTIKNVPLVLGVNANTLFGNVVSNVNILLKSPAETIGTNNIYDVNIQLQTEGYTFYPPVRGQEDTEYSYYTSNAYPTNITINDSMTTGATSMNSFRMLDGINDTMATGAPTMTNVNLVSTINYLTTGDNDSNIDIITTGAGYIDEVKLVNTIVYKDNTVEGDVISTNNPTITNTAMPVVISYAQATVQDDDLVIGQPSLTNVKLV